MVSKANDLGPSGRLLKENGHEPDSSKISKQDLSSSSLEKLLSSLDDYWAWELIAATISLAAFAALVVTLLVYDRREAPELPGGLTINALISILATITKSALLLATAAALSQFKWIWLRKNCALQDIQMLDDASRGPWGSFLLLFKLKGRYLITVGLAVTILALAFEPFVQQVTLFKLQTVSTPSSLATLQKATNAWLFGPNDGKMTNVWEIPIDEYMLRGLFSNLTSPFAPVCPSGACTWPVFETLAMCSRCVDVTNHFTKTGECRATPEEVMSKTRTEYHVTNCNYTIDDVVIPTYGWISPWSSMKQPQYGGPVMVTVADDGFSKAQTTKSNHMAGWRSPLMGFYRLMLNQTASDDVDSVLQDALQCALSFCVTQNHLTTNASDISLDSTTIAVAAVNGGNMTWISPESGTPLVDSSPALSWKANVVNVDDMAYAMSNFTNGSVVWYSMFGLNFETLQMDTFYTTNDFPGLFANVSLSLTKAILDQSNETITGSEQALRTILVIRWEWLTLPVIVLCSAITFLIITIALTRRQRTQVWKSSTLPLLFHGLDHLDRHWAGLKRISDMEGEAANIKIRLGRVHNQSDEADHVWKLLQVRGSGRT